MTAKGLGTVPEEFDYIVIGAGSAGCVVAGRLAQMQGVRILVLEAGPSDYSPWVHMPIGYGKLFYHPKMNWMYRTEPEPGLNDRAIYQPRGKVMGGSSSINAMVYARGQPQDYDGWAKQGNPGWGWNDVLAAYRRMESHALGASDWHGGDGPLQVSEISAHVHPLTRRFVTAAQEAGLDFNADLNGPQLEGVGVYQLTAHRGRRVSAARAWLDPARKTGRLRVETGALVCRILFDGWRAGGVEYRQHGKVLRANARKEIVLSGGAFNSPQILQLSGIGPADLLHAHGIPLVKANEAVGRHLQDHLCYDHIYRSNVPSLNDELLPVSGKLRVGLKYLLQRRGPLSLSVNQGGGFFRSRPDVERPDLQLYFSPLSYERAVPGVRALMKPDPFSGFLTSISPCRPASTGTVAVVGRDPTAAPRITANYLAAPEDLEALLVGAKFLRRLAAAPSLKAVVAEELRPGVQCTSDEAFIADIRARAYSVFHPCGTCRMGSDEGRGVVDARLRVHGITGLRVIDASIFPTIPSGNTNAPAMMVGMRGSDFLVEDASG